MKNVIAGLVLASLVAVASPAEARRWFRRSYTTSTCPNGQCYAPAPVAEEGKKMSAVPQAEAAQTTAIAAPMKPATTVAEEPTVEESTVAAAPAAAPTYYANNTRRSRLRWFRR